MIVSIGAVYVLLLLGKNKLKSFLTFCVFSAYTFEFELLRRVESRRFEQLIDRLGDSRLLFYLNDLRSTLSFFFFFFFFEEEKEVFNKLNLVFKKFSVVIKEYGELPYKFGLKMLEEKMKN